MGVLGMAASRSKANGVRHGGAGGVRLMGVRVITQQLGRRQALRRRPGSRVRDSGVHQARWSRLTAAARGGAASSFAHGGAGHRP
jgi:hypothetical protein